MSTISLTRYTRKAVKYIYPPEAGKGYISISPVTPQPNCGVTGSTERKTRGKKMIYYDGQEWRDPEELLHMAGMESGEKYEEACRFLAQEGYDL